jgi:hypothetical protein
MNRGGIERASVKSKRGDITMRLVVIDGPFTETKELIAGYWLWQVRSMDEAVEWLKRAPFDGGRKVEIRPVYFPYMRQATSVRISLPS